MNIKKEIVCLSFLLPSLFSCNEKRYNVKFLNYDGSLLQELKCKKNTYVKYTGPTPTRNDSKEYKYTFKNWDKELGKTLITSDTTFTALYSQETRKYSVTLHVNDSTKGSVSGGGEFDYGSNITIKAIPINDYNFEGWYLDSSYSKKLTMNKEYSFTINDGNVDLYAKFMEGYSKWDENHGVVPLINTIDNTLTYGLFPQSIVSPVNESNLIAELDKLTPSTYNYIFYNDEYYAKVNTAKPNDSSYTFSDGTTIVDGNTYYFKCEPIKWKIISSNNGTYSIDCSNILDVQLYGENYSGTKQKTDYKGEVASVYANNYKYSNIRTFLNTSFYKQAFFLNDKYVIESTIDNSASTTSSSDNPYCCDNTLDKVFLKSYKELVAISNREKKITDYSLANHCYMSKSSSTLRNGWYWSRSPETYGSNYISYITSSGGLGSDYVYSNNFGVSPSLNLKF